MLGGVVAVVLGFNLNTTLGLATIPLAAAGLITAMDGASRDTSRLRDVKTVTDGITKKAEDGLSALRERLERDQSINLDTASPEDLEGLLVRQSTLQTEISAIMSELSAVFQCEAPGLQQ